MTHNPNSPWTTDLTQRLSALMEARNPDGTFRHSVAAVAKALGVSQNAAVGKAHRIGCTPRQNPVQRGAAQAAPKARRLPRTAPQPPEIAAATHVRVVGGSCLWCDGGPGAYVPCTAKATRGCFCARHAEAGYVVRPAGWLPYTGAGPGVGRAGVAE